MNRERFLFDRVPGQFDVVLMMREEQHLRFPGELTENPQRRCGALIVERHQDII